MCDRVAQEGMSFTALPCSTQGLIWPLCEFQLCNVGRSRFMDEETGAQNLSSMFKIPNRH